MKKVEPWKRIVLIVIGLLSMLLAISAFANAKSSDAYIIIYAIGIFFVALSLWLLYAGFFGNHKLVTKALCGIDKGISAGL